MEMTEDPSVGAFRVEERDVAELDDRMAAGGTAAADERRRNLEIGECRDNAFSDIVHASRRFRRRFIIIILENGKRVAVRSSFVVSIGF